MNNWLNRRTILVGVLLAIGVISGAIAPAIGGSATAGIMAPRVEEVQVNTLGNVSFVVATSDGKVLATISALKKPLIEPKRTKISINISNNTIRRFVLHVGSRSINGTVIQARGSQRSRRGQQCPLLQMIQEFIS